MKKAKIWALFVILVLVVSLVVGCGEQPDHSEEKTFEETTATAVETIPEEEIIVIPDPEHFFGVDELVFEKFPESAVKAYYDLMVEKYGFTIKYPDLSLSHSNFLTYGETDNYNVWIMPVRGSDGLIYISFTIRDYCREEALETWGGEIEPYLYNPEHWMECSACEGSGRCSKCDGWGWVDTGGGDDISRSKCRVCNGKKKCPDCYDGKIIIQQEDDWDQLTDLEKMEKDWKRYSREVLERGK